LAHFESSKYYGVGMQVSDSHFIMLEIMNKYIGMTLILGLSGCPTWAPAYENQTPCDYEHLVNSSYIYTIQNTKEFKKEVFPYVEDTRKCVITMWVTIEDKTYPAQGSYVFGPDMTENQACEFAEKKAKEQVIREVSPVKLSSNTDLSCIKKDVVEAPKEEVVVSSKVVKADDWSIDFKPIRQSYSPDPTYYYGNYDSGKITLTSVLSLLLGGM